jgi:carboxypeptidase family protein/TonB-dependent receptor-like protein
MARTILRLGGVSAVLALLLASNALAQELATLRVTVLDTSGGVIPGASVTLKSTQTGAARTATTAENGLAVIAGLSPGSYELTAATKSFQPQTLPLQLSVGQVASLTVTLGVATRAEKVEVIASAAAQGIDVEKAELSQVIDTPKIADLPIQGREFIDFALLTPSVSVGRSTAIGAQSPFTETVLKLSFGGVRESHTTLITQDGLNYTTSISGVQRVTPSQDWVQEFRVVSSPYTADTGLSLGSIVNTVTKSGTNDFHGSVYEFFRNNKLNANNLLSSPGFNTLRFNQFGADTGGPIVREKMFFFAGYEGQRRGESPAYSSFILNNISAINTAKQSLGLQPEDLASVLQIEDYDKFITKWTDNLGKSKVLNFTYQFNDDRKKKVRGANPGDGLPSSYRDNPIRDQTIYGSLVDSASPNWTLETGWQFARRTFHLEPVGEGFEPAIQIPNLLSGGGFVGSFRFYREQRLQGVENVTYTHGNHAWKFGGEMHEIWTSSQDPLFTPGFAIFSPQSFFASPSTPLLFFFAQPREFFGQQVPARDPNFEAGLFTGPAANTFDQGFRLHYTHQIYGTYLQDAWKVRPSLTVNFGVRYEIETIPSAADTKLHPGTNHDTDYKDIQPRVSFAYSFHHGRGVVRGGYGIFVAPFVFSDIMVSWIGASEFTYMNQPLLPQFSDPLNRLIGLGASGAVGVLPSPPVGPGPLPGCPSAAQAFSAFTSSGAYPPPTASGPIPFPCLFQFPLGYAQKHFPRPYAQQASLQVEHQIGRSFFVSAGYQYLHGLRLPTYLSINGLPKGSVVNGSTVTCAATPPPGFPAGKTFFCPADLGFGFALFVTPQAYSIYHAGTVSLRKTFANHYSLLTNYTWSRSVDIETTINLPNSPENYLNLNLDRGVGDNHIAQRFTVAVLGEAPDRWRILRDFKASILASLQSARFYTINTGFDSNGDLFPFNDRVGTTGRNIYRGDPLYNVDLRIQRVIPIRERLKGEFSAEIFNLFNRPNVESVDQVYGAAGFVGPVPRHYKDGVLGPTGSFGTPKFAAPARQIQFSFRLNF